MKRPSLNFIYRLVWNKKRNLYMPVAENTPSRASQGFVLGVVLFTFCTGAASSALSQEPAPGELPTGGSIAAGSGNISSSSSQVTINQSSDRVVINWDTFNIGQDAAVTFTQPDSSSAALNRITDQNPSQIFGKLSANGQIYLSNPAGIVFGPSSQVNVGSLIASALNITDEDFMAGVDSFSGDSEGEVVNEGDISTSEGGVVALVGSVVENKGSIETPSSDSDAGTGTDISEANTPDPVKKKTGGVLLVAGTDVSLDFTGDELIRYQVDGGAVGAQVSNSGTISANGGLVVMTARAASNLTSSVVNNTGIIEAQTLHSRGGQIILDAQGGQATVSGMLNASSAESTGGKIVVTGDKTHIESGAHLTASGKTGGGQVLVGGSWQGGDPLIRQATETIVEQGALLEANATGIGDGGTVVAWSDIQKSDSVTRAYGVFEAKGGVNGGDGGRIETSGHWLDTTGVEGSAAAAHGNAGEWLFDPYNVTIVGANSNGSFDGGNPDTWAPSGDNSTILNTDINTKLEGGTSVTITTGSAGTQNGDITISSAITKASGNSDVTLILRAENSIIQDADISNTGGTGKLDIVFDADYDSSGNGDGLGIVLLKQDITTNGGDVSFGTGRTVTVNGGTSTIMVGGDVYVGGSSAQTISTNGGDVVVKGEMIVANTNGLTIDSANGDVRFHGVLNSGNTSYTYIANTNITWDQAVVAAKSGTGDAVGDTYLATITSRLENSIATTARGSNNSWLGGARVAEKWRWKTGPEGLEDSGDGRHFFTQNMSGATAIQGGTTVSGEYSNWNLTNSWDEPSGGTEDKLQFAGDLGFWNDLNYDYFSWIDGYLTETNLAASPLTITAGSGTVTFDKSVGVGKALASLNITSTSGVALKDAAVTTEGLQTYNANVTLGAASTTLTQTAANTDFTLVEGKSISNATGADASLTIKTTQHIVMAGSAGNGSSITSSTGKLNTVLWADSDNNENGSIVMQQASSITTNGGNLIMGGGSDPTTDYAVRTTGVGVDLKADTSIAAGGGNITIHGKTLASGAGMNVEPGASVTTTGTGTLTIVADGSGTTTGTQGLNADGAVFSTEAGNLTITGLAGGDDRTNDHFAYGVIIGQVSTTSGDIVINATEGIGAEEAGLFFENDTDVIRSTSGGDITLNVDDITKASDFASNQISSTGDIIIAPHTNGRTIVLAAAGTTDDLAIDSSFFSAGLQDGFASITVGDAAAGLISVGGDALSYNDSLTLKTNNSIFFSTTSALTGNNSDLTLWVRAGGNDAADDANEGSVWLPVGSSIDTGGGDVTIGGGTNPATGYALGDNGATSGENNARYRGVAVNGTIAAGGGNVSVLGRGNPDVLHARGVSVGGAISTTGVGTIDIRGIAKGSSDGVAFGDASVAGTTGTLSTVNGDITLTGTKDTGNNGVNLSTIGSGILTSGTGSLVMISTGDINGTGTVAVGGSTSLTAGTNVVTLNNSSNNFGGTVSVVSAGNLTLIDSNAMTLGAISSTGIVDIATVTNNLTLNGAISTSDTSAGAITLNAGKSTAAGTVAGGDIIIGGSGSVSTGAGGRATLYSGSVSNSTGLTALIGSGTGNFRYNSDEAAANYTAALGSGKYAIYREQPSVGITATNDTQAYTEVPYSGGNGVSSSGFVNGDTSAILGGTLAYGGTSQGAVNGGTYSITPSGYTNDLGYALAYTNGTLTITGGAPAPPPEPAPVLPSVPVPLPTIKFTPASVSKPELVALPHTPPEVLPAQNPNGLSSSIASPDIVTVLPEQPFTFVETDTAIIINLGEFSHEQTVENTEFTIPVFFSKDNEMAMIATFVITDTGGEISVSLGEGPLKSLKIGETTGSIVTQFVDMHDYSRQEVSVAVKEDGILVISVPQEMNFLFDEKKIVSIALAIAKQKLGIKIDTLNGVLIQILWFT
jgi:filamentous hemagglutinin family protein